jgi:hypothetical protein
MSCADFDFKGTAWIELESKSYKTKTCVAPLLAGVRNRPVRSLNTCPVWVVDSVEA